MKQNVFSNKSWAPFFFMAILGVVLSLFSLMVFNYITTFEGFLSLEMGTFLALTFTVLIQTYQLAYPAANASGKLDDIPYLNLGMGLFWIVTLVGDAATAWVYLRNLNSTNGGIAVIQVCVIAIFLIAEWVFWPLLRALGHYFQMIERKDRKPIGNNTSQATHPLTGLPLRQVG